MLAITAASIFVLTLSFCCELDAVYTYVQEVTVSMQFEIAISSVPTIVFDLLIC